MKSQENNSSGSPLLIIGAVFLIVLIGGWWVYSSRSKPKPVANNANAAQTPNNYESASPGAQPPHILGSPTAAVTVEEFADFQCPTCASVHTLMKQITTEYSARIKFIFRPFPLVQLHDKAYDAAVAAEAAGLQGKYWDMQNLLFTNQSTWAKSTEHRKLFNDYAQQIGLDLEKFNTDILGLPAKSRVDADLQRARTLKVSSTPTLYVNGIQIPFDQVTSEGLHRIIDAELQKAGSKTAPPGANDQKPSEKPTEEK